MLTEQRTELDSSSRIVPIQRKSRSVLVLVDDTRVLLPIARSLGRRGIQVDVAWCSTSALALRSRYVRKLHEISDPSAPANDWQRELRELMEKHAYDMLLPATERATQALHRTRNVWQDLPAVYLLNEKALTVASDKLLTQQVAKSLRISVPVTALADSAEEFHAALQRFNGSAVVKPIHSLSSDCHLEKDFARHIYSLREAEEYAALKNGAPWDLMVQENFSGTGMGVEVLAEHGEILVAFQHRRLHETTGYGSMYRQSEPVSPQLLEAATALAKATDFTGVGMFEFRRDERTGDFVLLEINGRFWGSLGLALASGVDFPFYLYQWHVEGRRTFSPEYRTQIRSRDLSGDVRWMVRSLKRKRPAFFEAEDEEKGWELNDRSRLQVVGDLLKLLGPRDKIDSFAWDDPQPAICELWRLGRSVLSRLLPSRTKHKLR
ncbi:MAG: ATP-grasp domain-containing protein [Pirellulales bacterium]|nr:ATP-grasp domain-containing protein [Pirellulales bacterium]